MSLQIFLSVFCILFCTITESDGEGSISITINPLYVREFSSYRIRCQYPGPGANSSTTGVLQVTRLSKNDVIYTYDFDASKETISDAMQIRSNANLNQTTNLLSIEVFVARASDSGYYNCSLVDKARSSAAYATTQSPLNVTGCVNGSQVANFSGCPSVSLGNACSLVCNSSDPKGVVSLSRDYDGSNPLVTNASAISYTIASVRNSDYGKYYCYVKTEACTSMVEVSIAPVSTNAKDANGTSCTSGCGSGIPGWGIALIVIACIVVAAIIVGLIIALVLYKKGKIFKKEGGVQPETGRQARTVTNDNFVMSKTKSRETKDKNGKESKEGYNNAHVVNFPDVKARKNQLPPLETQATYNRKDSPDVARSVGRPLPTRKSSVDETHSPDGGRRVSYTRRRSIDSGGSPVRRSNASPVRLPPRYDDDDGDRF